MSTEAHTHKMMPYHVRHCISRYAPELRDAINAEVAQLWAAKEGHVTLEEIGHCATKVLMTAQRYNTRMEQLCVEAFEAGRYRLLSDVIAELERRRDSRPAIS